VAKVNKKPRAILPPNKVHKSKRIHPRKKKYKEEIDLDEERTYTIKKVELDPSFVDIDDLEIGEVYIDTKDNEQRLQLIATPGTDSMLGNCEYSFFEFRCLDTDLLFLIQESHLINRLKIHPHRAKKKNLDKEVEGWLK
jgi:hypothetical protein